MRIPPGLCARCKGARNLCGLGYCPLLASIRGRVEILSHVSNRLVDGASPPSAVVGEKGYPRVSVYYGVPPGVHGEEAAFYDDPDKWHMRLGLSDIISLRSRLLSLRISVPVSNPYLLYEKEVGLAALSEKPVETEAELAKPVVPRITFDPLLPPQGPSAPATRIRVVDNPRLPRRLEKLIWDDVRAEEAVAELYRGGVGFYTAVRALTLGFLGRRGQRRLVPTRWGITAVDSIITRINWRRARSYPSINDVEVYYAEYLYNRYAVILRPGRLRNIWIEVWMPNSLWNPGAEPSIIEARDKSNGEPSIMDGGFLAARTPVVEHLARRRRSATAIILREVLPQYVYPVGSWQIRLTVRRALEEKPLLRNPSSDELYRFLRSRFTVPDAIIARVIKYVYHDREHSLLKYMEKGI